MNIEQASYTKFRMHLASFMNEVAKTHLPIRIVRRNNEPAYLISKEMYEYLVKQNFNKLEANKKTGDKTFSGKYAQTLGAINTESGVLKE